MSAPQVRTEPLLLVTQQSQVLRTSQANALFGPGVVRAAVAATRWTRPTRGVVVLHNGPLTPAQRDWVALLTCPEGSALGGLTALSYDGFAGFDPEHPVVVLPDGASRPGHEDIVPHWSTMLDARDVHPLRLPRRTRPARSLVDEAAWTTNERRARVLILAGAQQRLAGTRQFRDALSRRGPCRHRALIVESILDAAGGIQSLPELDFDTLRRDAGLPPPTRQSVLRRADGRFYLDVEWTRLGAACEIHRIPHLQVQNWDADLLRANEITLAGPRLLVFSSYAVRRQRGQVQRQLVALLRRGGWRG